MIRMLPFFFKGFLVAIISFAVGVTQANAESKKTPEITGIALGTTLVEAKGQVLKANPNFKINMLTQDGKEIGFDAVRLDKTEAEAIEEVEQFKILAGPNGQVRLISRTLVFDKENRPLVSTVIQQLREKYGNPTSSSPEEKMLRANGLETPFSFFWSYTNEGTLRPAGPENEKCLHQYFYNNGMLTSGHGLQVRDGYDGSSEIVNTMPDELIEGCEVEVFAHLNFSTTYNQKICRAISVVVYDEASSYTDAVKAKHEAQLEMEQKMNQETNNANKNKANL